jgi:murein endopeptidase
MLEPEIAALDDGAVDHLGVFVEPSLVLLRTSRNDHDVARAAGPLFGAEAELHLALEHPNDLLICMPVRLDMDAPAPPDDH